MSETRLYPNCGSYLAALSHFLSARFGGDYEVQLIDSDDPPSRLFQMRERYQKAWLKTLSGVAGLDTAATISMRVSGFGGQDLEVELGGAKWIDKAAVAGLGLAMSFGLLLVPASVGALRQRQLLRDVQQSIDDFFRRR